MSASPLSPPAARRLANAIIEGIITGETYAYAGTPVLAVHDLDNIVLVANLSLIGDTDELRAVAIIDRPSSTHVVVAVVSMCGCSAAVSATNGTIEDDADADEYAAAYRDALTRGLALALGVARNAD